MGLDQGLDDPLRGSQSEPSEHLTRRTLRAEDQITPRPSQEPGVRVQMCSLVQKKHTDLTEGLNVKI